LCDFKIKTEELKTSQLLLLFIKSQHEAQELNEDAKKKIKEEKGEVLEGKTFRIVFFSVDVILDMHVNIL